MFYLWCSFLKFVVNSCAFAFTSKIKVTGVLIGAGGKFLKAKVSHWVLLGALNITITENFSKLI